MLLAVGTDANIGKMTVMLQLRDALAAQGVKAGFAPTGQTGIFIEGWGLCVDAVVADFIAGAAEDVTRDDHRCLRCDHRAERGLPRVGDELATRQLLVGHLIVSSA